MWMCESFIKPGARLVSWNYFDADVGMCVYFTSGVACSEVEVDVLTGGHHIISTDIIMDVGDSLNPALDIGQV